MLSKLTDIIHEFRRNTVGVPSTELAEKVLTEIEVAGMMPPRLDEDKCQALMHLYYAGFTLYQWDEDFTKDEKAVAAYEKRKKWKEERQS